MQFFDYENNELYAEQISLTEIAQQFGTPCYVYSRAAIEANWRAFDNALADKPHRICYAVKANSNLAILNILARLGSGFDTVSIGEIARVIAAGGDPKKIIFSGVGKTSAEILRAIEIGIHSFNVESGVEITRLNTLAASQHKIINISLRINPDIDANTHPYISTGMKENKFGIDIADVLPLCAKIKTFSNLNLIGIACHIGSQLTTITPFLSAIDRVLDLVAQLKQQGFTLQQLDLGGGLGIRYHNEEPPTINEYVMGLREHLADCPLEIILEPGRAITANAGILLTRIEYLKHTQHKNFAIVDAAMNDLMRPALYNAWQQILPVELNNKHPEKIYDIVGPVCETADFLGRDRKLAVESGDLLAITCAGAYGFAMSSNYNSRPRAAEVMVDKNKVTLIRRRETIDELYAGEIMVTE
ncbi:MAG: diaminopimelate decarboxylase [Pseudomonadota bacterium]